MKELISSTIKEKGFPLIWNIMKNNNIFLFPKFSYINEEFVPELKAKIKKLKCYKVTETIKKIPLSENSKFKFRKMAEKVNEDFNEILKEYDQSIDQNFHLE